MTPNLYLIFLLTLLILSLSTDYYPPGYSGHAYDNTDTCPICSAGRCSGPEDYTCLCCPGGSYPNTEGNPERSDYDSGSYSSNRTTTCTLYDPGTYASTESNSSCVDYPAGSLCPHTGMTNHDLSQEGTYNSLTRQTQWQNCPEGIYNPFKGEIV